MEIFEFNKRPKLTTPTGQIFLKNNQDGKWFLGDLRLPHYVNPLIEKIPEVVAVLSKNHDPSGGVGDTPQVKIELSPELNSLAASCALVAPMIWCARLLSAEELCPRKLFIQCMNRSCESRLNPFKKTCNYNNKDLSIIVALEKEGPKGDYYLDFPKEDTLDTVSFEAWDRFYETKLLTKIRDRFSCWFERFNHLSSESLVRIMEYQDQWSLPGRSAMSMVIYAILEKRHEWNVLQKQSGGLSAYDAEVLRRVTYLYKLNSYKYYKHLKRSKERWKYEHLIHEYDKYRILTFIVELMTDGATDKKEFLDHFENIQKFPFWSWDVRPTRREETVCLESIYFIALLRWGIKLNASFMAGEIEDPSGLTSVLLLCEKNQVAHFREEALCLLDPFLVDKDRVCRTDFIKSTLVALQKGDVIESYFKRLKDPRYHANPSWYDPIRELRGGSVEAEQKTSWRLLIEHQLIPLKYVLEYYDYTDPSGEAIQGLDAYISKCDAWSTEDHKLLLKYVKNVKWFERWVEQGYFGTVGILVGMCFNVTDSLERPCDFKHFEAILSMLSLAHIPESMLENLATVLGKVFSTLLNQVRCSERLVDREKKIMKYLWPLLLTTKNTTVLDDLQRYFIYSQCKYNAYDPGKYIHDMDHLCPILFDRMVEPKDVWYDELCEVLTSPSDVHLFWVNRILPHVLELGKELSKNSVLAMSKDYLHENKLLALHLIENRCFTDGECDDMMEYIEINILELCLSHVPPSEELAVKWLENLYHNDHHQHLKAINEWFPIERWDVLRHEDLMRSLFNRPHSMDIQRQVNFQASKRFGVSVRLIPKNQDPGDMENPIAWEFSHGEPKPEEISLKVGENVYIPQAGQTFSIEVRGDGNGSTMQSTAIVPTEGISLELRFKDFISIKFISGCKIVIQCIPWIDYPKSRKRKRGSY